MTDPAHSPAATQQPDSEPAGGGPAELEALVRQALQLNGVVLAPTDVALTAAEFGRALEIARPLLQFHLPDGLDLAGVYRP